MDDDGSVKGLILSYDYREIGEEVLEKDKIDRDVMVNALALTRRKFKKNELLLMDVIDDDSEGTEGIVFTEDRLIYWDEDGSCKVVVYKDIDKVDFGDAEVHITTKSGEEEWITVGYDDMYGKEMYLFLMDIVDRIEELEE